jgi:DNA-binding CsgD family transcriptional regulator
VTTKSLEQMASEAERRLEEIKPVYEEYLEIVRFLATLRFAEAAPASPRRARRASNRLGRPVGTGPRQHQVMRLLSDHGPMTINEMASHMGMQPNYLYRSLPLMQERGQVVCNGRHWDLAGPRR